jgi:Fe-S cluster biosynthesis and repair protein YggX
LNLNFNPFPDTERKKIYNVIGNQRSQLKKTAINELKLNNREFFDIVVIDQKSQLEKAE